MASWIFDIEGDSLNPTKIHCLSAKHVDGGDVFSTTDYELMRKMLTNAEVLIGHHIQRFDIPVLERLLGIKITATLIDTLALSWVLDPQYKGTERKKLGHGLAQYGEEFGVPKPKIDDWENLPIEEYIRRCEEDVKITYELWKKQLGILMNLYGSKDKAWPFLKYIEFKMDCAREQERSRWKLDVPFCEEALISLSEEKIQKSEELAAIMPRVPTYAWRQPPAKPVNKDGTLSATGEKWKLLMAYLGLPEDHAEKVKVVTGTTEPNPDSNAQKKEYLFSLGWVPQTFKHDKDKDGNLKEIPQIQNEKRDGICPSIKLLYEIEPRLEALEGLTVITHRANLLKGFLRDQEDGWLSARVQGLTNTLRFQHAEVVNLPKVGVAYGDKVRGSLVAHDGHMHVGADMTALEDRLKHHFIYPHDPKYVERMSVPDYDPHLALAVMARLATEQDADLYKWYNKLKAPEQAAVDPVKVAMVKRIGQIRSIAKNGNYACQYGAGAARIAITAKISLAQARIVHEGYWNLNWAIKVVAAEQKVKEINGWGYDIPGVEAIYKKQKWLYNPISGFWYSLREEKDRFSTLIQGSASFVFDKWVYNFRQECPQLTGQFHDEVVVTPLLKDVADVEKKLQEALELTNEQLKLNRRLDIGIQTGQRYADIH